MANTINTRIALKSDLSANWESSTLIALKGEYLFDSQRGYIKVGDGTKTWSELPTIRLPKDAIDDLKSVDTNTIYKFAPASGNTIKLLSADGTLANPVFDDVNPVSTFKIDLSSEISAIADAYRAIEQTRAEGIEATLAQAIADNTAAIGAEVERATGAEEALQAAITAEETRAKGEENTLSGLISAEETRAKEAEETLQDNIDALSTYADETFETKEDATAKYNELTGKIDAETTARETADTELESRAALSVENLSSEVNDWLTDSTKGYVNQDVDEDNKIATLKDIAGLSGVVHFRGASETFDGTGKPADIEWYQTHDPEKGDIVLNVKTSKEYLFDGTIWRELGDEGLYVKKSFELNGHALSTDTLDLVGSDITVGGIYNGKTVDEALGQVSADAKAYTDEQIAALDVAEVTVGESKTIASISETDGKIAVVTADIKIAESQVTNLPEDLSELSGMVEAEAAARAQADSDLSTDYVAKIGEEKARAEGIEAGLRTDLNTVSADLDTLETEAIKSIKLNGADFTTANNAASLEISAIICGGAE